MISHKHLRTVIEDIYLNDNRLTQDLLSRLMNEFRYSNLYIPAKRVNNKLNFIIYQDDELKVTPLFTDLDEFHKFYKNEDVEVLNNSFELYQNIVRAGDIEGYILNPASEKYLFNREFILSIKNIPKTSFYTTDAYTSEELKKIRDSIDNFELEEFIGNPNNIGDYERLFERLANSRLLTLMQSDADLTGYASDGVIDMREIGPLASMYVDNVGGKYATIFSGEDKILNVNSDMFKYSQLINLATLVNFVLAEDMEGIVLNPDSENILIPRATLLRYSLGFERFANDEKLCESIYYMFLI